MILKYSVEGLRLSDLEHRAEEEARALRLAELKDHFQTWVGGEDRKGLGTGIQIFPLGWRW